MKILEVKKEGYQTVHSFDNGDGWRVGLISYAERFTNEGMTYLERHNLTDEIFLLLRGEAVLLLDAQKVSVQMEKGKAYNVEQGEWHNIILEKDSIVAVVENKNTSKENTDYMDI
jgi:mannose-6-phosphate isomerase-like protein (cupin superfamily)